CDFSFQHIISLTRKVYFAEKVWVTKRKSCGGPRCPKKAMVTRFPFLQQRHFLSIVWGIKTLRSTFKLSCKPWSFPRFQLLLKIDRKSTRLNSSHVKI